MRFFLVLVALFIGAFAQDHTTKAHHEHHPTTHHHHLTTQHQHHDDHHETKAPVDDHSHLGRQIAELLVMRGENVIHLAEHQIKEIEKAGFGHLIAGLKNEVALAEQMVSELRRQLHDMHHFDAHRLHQIEEMLLQTENRISEELHIIEEIKRHPEQHIPVDRLIENAEKLEKKAKEVLHEYGHHTTKVSAAIHNELHFLDEFVQELKKHPKGTELIKEASQLLRHERSMHSLLAKAEEELKHGHHN